MSRTFRWKISPLVTQANTLSKLSALVAATRTFNAIQPVRKQTRINKEGVNGHVQWQLPNFSFTLFLQIR